MKKFFLHSILVLLIFISTGLSFAQNNIELTDIWTSNTFRPKSISDIRSMNNGEQYCVLKRNEIVLYDYKTGKEASKLLKATQLNKAAGIGKIVINDYSFSPDESQILLATETERIYRHSTRAEFYIWDIKNEKLTKLSENGKQRLAEYSPDGTQIAFVRKNNFFIKDIGENIEIQITNDGENGKIINGT
nr:DPP IV N-terminal domain-containing protein [Bacteroidota bacterium]